jgi:phage/plasmid primase-like uncharacterized protein
MNAEINKSQLNDVNVMLKGLALDGPKILSRTLNKTATRAQKRSSEEIRKQVNLKAAYVKGKLRISRATFKKLSARLSAEKRGVLMTRYPHSVLKRGGVSVKIKRSGGRAKVPGAFITTVRAGAKTVEVLAIQDRSGKKYKTGNSKMKVLYSPSVSQVFNDVRDDVDDELVEFLATATDQEIATALRGY